MGFEGEVRDLAGEGVAEAFVKRGRTVFGGGVEDEEGAGVGAGRGVGGVHQGGGEAAAAVGGAGHQLGDLGAVGLVGGQVEQEGDGGGEDGAVPGAEEDAAALSRRDRLDSTRAVSPLGVADGARVIDTTERGVDDIVEEVLTWL